MGPSRPGLRTAYALTVGSAAVMTAVSAVGVFATDWLYRDNDLITATFRGQDVVTLVVAVPLLLLGLLRERQGSLRGRVLWLGMLFYSVYGYLFYAVAAAYNPLFLLYVAGVGLPLYALLFAVPRLDLTGLAATMVWNGSRLVALGYTGLVAVGLGLLWVGMSLASTVTGVVPRPVVDSGHPTGVVFAIDLVLLVPPMLLAAVWLARGEPRGWLLAGVLSVGGTVYTLSLAAASIEVARRGAGAGAELPVWTGLTALGVVAVTLLLAGMRGSRAAVEPT